MPPARCRATSAANAAAPHAAHTTAYPPRNAATTRFAPSWRRAAWVNSRTIGRLDGSIIAATITCHASRNATALTQNGGRSTVTHSGSAAVVRARVPVQHGGRTGGLGDARRRPGREDRGEDGGGRPRAQADCAHRATACVIR